MGSHSAVAINRSINQTPRVSGHLHATELNAESPPSRSDELCPIRDADPYGALEKIADRRAGMSVRGLDFLSIRLVVLCAELGCLSAAARGCNISLSTASHRLTNVEKVFDTRFFKRHYLGLQQTKAGTVFSRHAREILLTMYSAERQLEVLTESSQ